MTRREQIARIVDPEAWRLRDLEPSIPKHKNKHLDAMDWERYREIGCVPSLAKADQIMAVEEVVEASREWRHSRADMASYDAATGEQVSFIYLPDDTRIAVGGGGDVAAQVREIVEAHNATLKAPTHDQ